LVVPKSIPIIFAMVPLLLTTLRLTHFFALMHLIGPCAASRERVPDVIPLLL